MERRMWTGLAAGVGSAALALSGCSSSGGSTNPAVSSAVAGVQSAASSALGGLASAGTSAFASAASSAAAAASSALASVKGGLDAKDEVTLGSVSATSDGRVQVPLTVNNKESQGYKYTVQVNFNDASGNLLDVTVVTVQEVPAGGTGQATATSNRDLSGTVTATVERAVRY
ncbi:hypothetical protein GCM10010441_61950 [Kitasatospora paracochleata]|uniref:Lipoprotein n=1 Tax=Kitasatospora paracochleata TaxID=58354 RepID=A0ABT1IZK6_9ACTN|nr:hypothetical protein [Kitasatospora paracochleata]MCP2310600.1 hypothetical protein [Kitasatospora paracochleata]